jgi:hypothetical protein
MATRGDRHQKYLDRHLSHVSLVATKIAPGVLPDVKIGIVHNNRCHSRPLKLVSATRFQTGTCIPYNRSLQICPTPSYTLLGTNIAVRRSCRSGTAAYVHFRKAYSYSETPNIRSLRLHASHNCGLCTAHLQTRCIKRHWNKRGRRGDNLLVRGHVSRRCDATSYIHVAMQAL